MKKTKPPELWTEPGEYHMPKETAAAYARRGTVIQAAKAKYMIEGEHVSAADVAQRLGCAYNTASRKLKAARAMDGPVTWQRLREVSSK